MVNNIEDMKLCLGEGVEREINGKKFTFYMLDSDHIPNIIKLESNMRSHLKGKETDEEKQQAVIEALSNDTNVKLMTDMMMQMVKDAFPEADDKTLKRFLMKNFGELQEVFVELHIKQDNDAS